MNSKINAAVEVMNQMIDLALTKAQGNPGFGKPEWAGFMDEAFKELAPPLFASRAELSEWFEKGLEITEAAMRDRFTNKKV